MTISKRAIKVANRQIRDTYGRTTNVRNAIIYATQLNKNNPDAINSVEEYKAAVIARL